LVSIIVPCYNHEKYLQERLRSIFYQKFQDYEVILLDDASTDNSLNILKEYVKETQVRCLKVNKKNSGSPFKQWEEGIKLANGDFIWIAESDDSCEPEFLNTLVPVLESDKSIGLAYCQSRSINEHSKLLNSWVEYTISLNPDKWKKDFKEKGLDFISKYMVIKNAIPNASAVVWRRSVLVKEVFKQIRKYRLHGDRLFWSHLLLRSNVYFRSIVLNYFRIHPLTSRAKIAGWKAFEENLDFLLWAKKNGIVINDVPKLQDQLIVISSVLPQLKYPYILFRIMKKLKLLDLMKQGVLNSIKSKIKGPFNKSIVHLVSWSSN